MRSNLYFIALYLNIVTRFNVIPNLFRNLQIQEDAEIIPNIRDSMTNRRKTF